MPEEQLRATAHSFPAALLEAIEAEACAAGKGHCAAGVGSSGQGRAIRWYFEPHPLNDGAMIWVEFRDHSPPQSLRFERRPGQPWQYEGTWIGPSRIDALIAFEDERRRNSAGRN